MNYLITGATGFIGRFVVDELLKQPNTCIYAVVRNGSEDKLEKIRQKLGNKRDQLVTVTGDLTEPGLGIPETDIYRLKGHIDHVFHLAAIYDLNADAKSQQRTNVEGTRHALQAAEKLEAGCFHHVSSIAVAGLYPGTFTESMFAEGTNLTHPYFATKHLAEACVRNEASIPYRIYRPSMVVGHSKTGVMDKIDGPYYLFQLLEQLAKFLPNQMPMIGLEGGQFNIVPVDYVAQAMIHIAQQPDLDGQCFHLTDPNHYTMGQLLEMIAEQSPELPDFKWQVPNTLIELLPDNTIPYFAERNWIQNLLKRLGIAPSALTYITYPTTYDRSHTAAALANSDIEPPQLETYMPKLWKYWSKHLSPRAIAQRSQDDKVLFRKPALKPYLRRARDHWKWNYKSIFRKDAALQQRVSGKVIALTGASSGIGAEVAHRLSNAGAIVILIARSKDKLDEIANDISRNGGRAFSYSADLTNGEAVDEVCQKILNHHGRVDILINNAGRSIRRSIKFSFDRFHDYERTMQLNYFGSVRMAMNLMPGMLERNEGHIINVSTVGVQANPARFSAYLGSKWALEGWSWVAANELAHTGVRVSTINYPLVRTPMIAPTKIYDYMPVMSPERAVEWMLDVVITRNKRKLGPLGLGALAMYYVLPKTSESIVNLSYQLVYETPPAIRLKRSKRSKVNPSTPLSINRASDATPQEKKGRGTTPKAS
ncbi:MAG: SDR family NAD(P)-dependent oxidoreductase [Pseudomonadales bacterium]|nr:SDR family NAD(P)-dependent oxidoreductase [Pseudomonadales bacterium]